jgi:hypothetical protein
VINQKRIFLFRTKTNNRQENAAEYSADNKYSAHGSKHYKKVKFALGKKSFLGWQLQVPVDKNIVCMHKSLTKSTKKQNFSKKWLGNGKLLNKTFFVFGSTRRLFVLAEYSANNFRPKMFSVNH